MSNRKCYLLTFIKDVVLFLSFENQGGEDIKIDFVRGSDFDLTKDYDLIIHCGACMFTRNYVLDRVNEARKKNIPMTNYGMVLAYLQGIPSSAFEGIE